MLINGNSSNRIDGNPSDFKIRLKTHDDDHNTKFGISLSQAIIPYTWTQFIKDDYFQLIIGNTIHKIDYGYNDGNYYITDIINHLKSRLNLYSIGFTWDIWYNKHNNKIQFSPSTIPIGGLWFDFTGAETATARSLNKYMGFERQVYSIPVGGITSTIPIEINDQFFSILLSASTQLTKNYNGDSQGLHTSRIFTRIPLIGVFGGSIVWQNVDNSNSSIEVQGLNTLHFELQDSRGFSLNLKNDWNFTLNIQQVQPNYLYKISRELATINSTMESLHELLLLNLIGKDIKSQQLKEHQNGDLEYTERNRKKLMGRSEDRHKGPLEFGEISGEAVKTIL